MQNEIRSLKRSACHREHIPLRKLPQALADPDLRCEAVISLETGAVRICGWHVAKLHADKLSVAFKIIIFWQNAGTNQLFQQCGDIVVKVFGRSATNVVDGVGRQRETIFAGLLLGRTLHHAEYSFHDVVHVCEVALAVAVVEDLDGLASLQLLRGGEVELIRAAGGPYTVKKRRLEIGK